MLTKSIDFFQMLWSIPSQWKALLQHLAVMNQFLKQIRYTLMPIFFQCSVFKVTAVRISVVFPNLCLSFASKAWYLKFHAGTWLARIVVSSFRSSLALPQRCILITFVQKSLWSRNIYVNIRMTINIQRTVSWFDKVLSERKDI